MESCIRTRRIMNDLKDFYKEETHGMFVTDYQDDLKVLQISFCGVDDTEFEGGSFDLEIKPSRHFPFQSPKMFFKTPVWHPNVALNGKICMNILDDDWHAGISIKECVEAARSLLKDPNPRSPLNGPAAGLFERDPQLYWSTAVAWTRIHAGGMMASDVDEKLSILVALGMDEKEALLKGTENSWNIERTIADLHL